MDEQSKHILQYSFFFLNFYFALYVEQYEKKLYRNKIQKNYMVTFEVKANRDYSGIFFSHSKQMKQKRFYTVKS